MPVASEVFFRTPSKNIVCHLTTSAVRCDILRKSWSPPAKPPGCELDYGFGLYIEDGKADFTCTGDSLISTATTTLEYGQSYRSAELLCESEAVALTCRDERSGRGFTLATGAYHFF